MKKKVVSKTGYHMDARWNSGTIPESSFTKEKCTTTKKPEDLALNITKTTNRNTKAHISTMSIMEKTVISTTMMAQ